MILAIITVKKMKTDTKNFFWNDMKIITINYCQFVVSDDNLLSFFKKKISKFFDFFCLIVILYHFLIFHSKFHICHSNFFENFFSKTKKSDFPW